MNSNVCYRERRSKVYRMKCAQKEVVNAETRDGGETKSEIGVFM